MLFPFFGPPIAQALRAVEAVVDVRRRARPPAMARRSQCAADVRVCTHRPHPDAEGQGHGGPLVSDGLARRCGQYVRVVEPRNAAVASRLRLRCAGSRGMRLPLDPTCSYSRCCNVPEPHYQTLISLYVRRHSLVFYPQASIHHDSQVLIRSPCYPTLRTRVHHRPVLADMSPADEHMLVNGLFYKVAIHVLVDSESRNTDSGAT
jgi:hypothetical protein